MGTTEGKTEVADDGHRQLSYSVPADVLLHQPAEHTVGASAIASTMSLLQVLCNTSDDVDVVNSYPSFNVKHHVSATASGA